MHALPASGRLLTRARCALAGLAVAGWLAACGGGGGDATPATTLQGSVSVSLAGSAAPEGVDHVWVTVQSLAVHENADQPWSGADSSWHVMRLAQPLTLDLVALVNGGSKALAVGQLLPAGSYGQLRLFLAAHDSALSEGAKALQLAYNDQVDYTDTAGTVRHVPLELPDTLLGLRLAGPFTVQDRVDTGLVLQWDLERSLARVASEDGIDRFMLRPDLRGYDLASSGAITGLLDKALLCPAGVRRDDCIHDVAVSALLVDANGRLKRSVRSSPLLVGSDYAVFTLYPLPPLAAGQRFDVLIRGRNLRTTVVRAVPASPAGVFEVLPTRLGLTPGNPTVPLPLPLVLQAGADADAETSNSLASPGARLLFGQSLAGESALLEVASAVTDPLSGLLAQPVALPTGALRVATYQAEALLEFSDQVPQQGEGGYGVVALGGAAEEPGATVALATAPATSTRFTASAPTAAPGLGSAVLTVNLSGNANGRYDAALLVVSDANGVLAV
jgi:hypothetical protein